MRSYRSSSSVRRLAVVIIACAIVAACSEPQFNLPTSPTSSDSTSTSTSTTDTTTDPKTFSGTLDMRGQRFYSFTVPSTRSVHITLQQLTTQAETPSTATLILGLGQPSGTGCAMLREVDAGASASPQIDESLTAGIYCTQLSDPGTLTAPVNFSVLIEFP